MNELIKATPYFKGMFDSPMTYLSVRSLLMHFDLSQYSKVYFGRRYLSEPAHAILVADKDDADVPPYKGGVGFILLKDNLVETRNLKCTRCHKEPLSPEEYIMNPDDGKYICDSCTPTNYLLEDVK